MEKGTLSKLMSLKKVKGFGNKKIIDKIVDIDRIDSVYSKLINESLLSFDNQEEMIDIIDNCKRDGINIISYFDKEYPSLLKNISTPPIILFTKGNLKLFSKPSISIVGTRHASDRSVKWAYEMAKELASCGYVIISGGAKGIDTASHEGSLASGGDTISVLGCGLNNIYPKENEQLINRIMSEGLVISEYAPDKNVSRINLLERNRITSGLGESLLIVATNISGGSISQFKVAQSQKKKIFCPHPSLSLEHSDGIIDLIKTGGVHPIKSIGELLNYQRNNEVQSVLLNI